MSPVGLEYLLIQYTRVNKLTLKSNNSTLNLILTLILAVVEFVLNERLGYTRKCQDCKFLSHLLSSL